MNDQERTCSKCGQAWTEYMPDPCPTSTYCLADIEDPSECGFYVGDEFDLEEDFSVARICYCMTCGEGEKDLFEKYKDSEEYNGLADLHFVSKSDPRWDSFEWSSLPFIDAHPLANRVIARKIESLGSPPADLQVHICEWPF